MTKRTTKLKAVTDASPQSSRGRGSKPPSADIPFVKEIEVLSVQPVGEGVSEEQALNVLLSSITDKLGDQSPEKGQLYEFLHLILDTDPALKEEILWGIRVRK